MAGGKKKRGKINKIQKEQIAIRKEEEQIVRSIQEDILLYKKLSIIDQYKILFDDSPVINSNMNLMTRIIRPIFYDEVSKKWQCSFSSKEEYKEYVVGPIEQMINTAVPEDQKESITKIIEALKNWFTTKVDVDCANPLFIFHVKEETKQVVNKEQKVEQVIQ